jgi:hypothetical protein
MSVTVARGGRTPAVLGIAAIAAAIVAATALLPPLPEPQIFRAGFVDTRTFLGIPNFWNVISNVPFLVVGVWGLAFLAAHATIGRPFADPRERWPYVVCFAAVALTSFGSGYFHLDIDEAGLFWDRLPMAVGFMALLTTVIVERVDARLGLAMLVPLVLLGAASVFYWRSTGNLLPYALVQYGSIAAILVLCAAFSSRYARGTDLVHVVAIYAAAKLAELLDARIYALGEILSGHTLKHLIAGLAAYWILRMLRLRAAGSVAA